MLRVTDSRSGGNSGARLYEPQRVRVAGSLRFGWGLLRCVVAASHRLAVLCRLPLRSGCVRETIKWHAEAGEREGHLARIKLLVALHVQIAEQDVDPSGMDIHRISKQSVL